MELCCKKQEVILKLLDSATVYKEIEKKKENKDVGKLFQYCRGPECSKPRPLNINILLKLPSLHQ
jgi:hypothetical protein